MKRRIQFGIKAACMAVVISVCAAAAHAAGLRSVRVIEDPHSGRRWVLASDPKHPGGPGKLVPQPAGAAAKSEEAQKALPVIRASDRVLVEENTRVARGLFEGVALSTATKGASFRVRLRVGGRVVWAVATGPGRAVLAGADEVGQ
jgi:hypothetical protein